MAEHVAPSGYEPLTDYLASHNEQEVSLSVAELERILGRRLPRSAYIRTWWSNTWRTPQNQAWQAAGWLVKERRVRERLVTFARRSGPEG